MSPPDDDTRWQPGVPPRSTWGDEAVSTIWRGIRLEIAYRTGVDPDKLDILLADAMPEKYPAGEWDVLLEPVIIRIMRDLGLEDNRLEDTQR